MHITDIQDAHVLILVSQAWKSRHARMSSLIVEELRIWPLNGLSLDMGDAVSNASPNVMSIIILRSWISGCDIKPTFTKILDKGQKSLMLVRGQHYLHVSVWSSRTIEIFQNFRPTIGLKDKGLLWTQSLDFLAGGIVEFLHRTVCRFALSSWICVFPFLLKALVDLFMSQNRTCLKLLFDNLWLYDAPNCSTCYCCIK